MSTIIHKYYNLLFKIGKYFGKNQIRINYHAGKQRLDITCPKSFEDRSIKSLEMFLMAFEYAKPSVNKSFTFFINCEDYPKYVRHNQIVFSYTKDDASNSNNLYLIPDFCFLNWKESGMLDYDAMCNSLLTASEKPPKYDTLFWIGNTKTHPTRKTLCSLSETDSRIEAYGMDWKYKDGRAIPSRFVSLKDHTQYKYLIDVQGVGYSGRVKVLMFSGRPLFIANRKWKEYWYKDLLPFEHYIPVKEDLSDLTEMLDWAEQHPEECMHIAKNAQEYAKKNLTKQAALEYYTKLIIHCANDRR